MNNVVITGLGVHTGAGDLGATRALLACGQSLLRPYAIPATVGLPPLWGSLAAPFELAAVVPDPKLCKYMSDAAGMAVLVTRQALDGCGLSHDQDAKRDLALYVSTGLVAFDLTEVLPVLVAAASSARDHATEQPFTLPSEAFRRCNPLLPFRMLLNMPLGLTSIALGIGGANAAVYPGSGQAAATLEQALRGIVHGRSPGAVWCGSTRQLSLGPVLTALKSGRVALATEPSASPAPDRLALADAAASLVIESEDAATRRQATVHARLLAASSLAGGCTSSLQAFSDLLAPLSAHPPERLWLTGVHSDEQRQALAQAWRAELGTDMPPAQSYDAQLGFAGAAALPLYVALACAELSAGSATAHSRGIGVISSDFNGALGAAVVGAP
jgi:3-oxoacyl-(acyl-carrier-protein) synthase